MLILFSLDRRSDRSPLLLLIVGFVFVSLGVYGALNGRVWVRSAGWVYRAEEPKTYWWNVFLDFLCGLFFIGYCLYLVNGT